jgi:ribosome-associated toxin RatA of RatAB toxin-antitoxin module
MVQYWATRSPGNGGFRPVSKEEHVGLTIILVAGVVAALAVVGLNALRKSIASDGTRGAYRSMIEARRVLPAEPRAVWSLVSDLAHYADFAPGLSFSRVLCGHGLGARRECGDYRGRTWTERCTLWQDGRAYAMEVDTAAEDYPFPLKALRGEWYVTPTGNGTEMAMRFDFTPKGGVLGEMLAALSARRARRDIEAVLDRLDKAVRTGSATAVA